MEACVVHAVDPNTSCAATTAVGVVGALNVLVAVIAGFPTMTARWSF